MGSVDLAKWNGGNQACLIDHALEFEAMEANDMDDAKVSISVARSSGSSCRTRSSTSERPKKHQRRKHHDGMFGIEIQVESSVKADLIHRDERLINFKDSELRELHVGLCPAAGSVRQRKRGLVPMVKPAMPVETIRSHTLTL